MIQDAHVLFSTKGPMFGSRGVEGVSETLGWCAVAYCCEFCSKKQESSSFSSMKDGTYRKS